MQSNWTIGQPFIQRVSWGWRRLFGVAALCGMLALMSGCSGLGSKILGSRVINVNQAQLLEQFLKFKPEHLDILRKLDMSLSVPRIRMDSEQNRIKAEWDLEMKKGGLLSELLGQKAFKETFGISTQLKFQPEKKAIVLKGVQLDGLDVGSHLSPEYGALINRFIDLAIEDGLNEYPIYQFKDKDLRRAGLDWLVKGIDVQKNGLQIKVAPK